MSGELLVQRFDPGRFSAIRPTLVALDGARRLGPEASSVLVQAIAPGSSRWIGRETLTLLSRIVAAPGLDLRVYLAPLEIDACIDAIVRRVCFTDDGEFSLVDEVGRSWVVLDAAQAELISLPWFTQLFWREDPTLSVPSPFPVRGEGRFSTLTPRGLSALVDGLSGVRSTRHASALAALSALAEGARSEGMTLAYTSLL